MGWGPWRTDPPPPQFTPFPDAAMTRGVCDRFLEVANQYATEPAVRSPAGTWTYGQLLPDAGGVAAGVNTHLGGRPPTPVAVLADHDGPLVVAILGIILAGHVVVVLDPAAPPPQTAHVLAESDAPLLLHDRVHASAAAELTARSGRVALELDSLGPAAADPAPRRPADPVMLAFTSGTSGEPKAGTITHGVLLNLVRGATNALGIGPHDRMPMLFPVSLAVAAYPLFLPLLNGGTLATLDVRSVGLAPVASFLAAERITLAYMAPTVIRFLVDALGDATFPDLRMIALGGELVDAEAIRLTRELFAPRHIATGFGTTETGVVTLYVLDGDEEPDGPVPSGYPVPDVELHISDEAGRPVATGASGEIAVASPHLFAGYWGHPELSAQVLAPDPGGRGDWSLYRTGDLGRVDDYGALTVLGRLDTKVKVRGRFVVLGDVEADLHEIEGIADAVVVPTTHDGNVELFALVAPEPGAVLDPPTLRARLLETREGYRVPSRWEVVSELPRLPNGKIDRQAVLDRPPSAPAPPASSDDTPDVEGGVVSELHDLWQLLLPAQDIGLDDDFTSLGGDSLLAAQMLVMAEHRLAVTVPMSELLHATTIRQLAASVRRIRTDPDAGQTTVACVQPGDESARPRLWFAPDLPGSAYRVRHVVAALDPRQAVWSFESPFLRGEPNPFTVLDTFVARLLVDLRHAQPRGPYWLAGYSFGGICAYEMARQLTRDGDEVAFVGIIDVGPGYRGPNWAEDHSPPWPYFGVPHPPPEDASPTDVARHYRDMVRRNPLGAARHLTLRTGLARRLDRRRFAADIRRTGRVRPEWRLWYAWEEHWRLAVKAWDRTRAYDGEVHLFWADQTGATDGTMGWGPLVERLHIHRFPGSHDDLLEVHGAPALGGVLDSVIDGVAGHRFP